MKWRFFLPTLAAIGIGLAIAVWWFWEVPLVSPLSAAPVFQFLNTAPPTSTGKAVYGFVPYWNVNKTTVRPELTHLSYFSLTIAADGSLDRDPSDPGFQKLQSDEFLELATQMTNSNRQVELTLTQFIASDIETFLGSQTAQDTFIQALDSVLIAYPFTGVNIDIEHPGNPSALTRQRLSLFMQRLNQHLDKKYGQVQLSIDMYASASTSNNIWDIEALGKEVDYIVIMAYDFHRRSSPQAGPVAPLFGGKQNWDMDISLQLQAFLDKVPSQKLLLGVPFYGYEWQTVSGDAQANTYPDSGSTASYARVQELLSRKDELQLEEKWNEAALSPYLSYTEDGETFLVYYENSRSLSYKLDFVNQLDLGGIAIWALGYEGDFNELWDVIQKKLDQPTLAN